MTSLGLVIHVANAHQGKHLEVTHQGPEWIGKGRWPVVFDEEMGEPRESVRTQGNGKQKPGAGIPGQYNQWNDCGRTDKVQRACQRHTVFANIERPEIVKGLESFRHNMSRLVQCKKITRYIT